MDEQRGQRTVVAPAILPAAPSIGVLELLSQMAEEVQEASPWIVGEEVLGGYRVEEDLGHGSFGHVYRLSGQQGAERIDHAVKRLRWSEGSEGAPLLSLVKFMREIHTLFCLPVHPHLVTCRFFRVVDETGNEVVLFSEYVAGGSVANQGEALKSLADVLDIAIQSAWGLHAVHAAGFVHGDVKPANLLRERRSGQVKVSDFGTARPLVEGEVHEWTPAFGSPEQCKHEALTAQSDQWSWGLTVLCVLAGGEYWEKGEEAAKVLAGYNQHRPAHGRPVLPDWLRAVLAKCFAPAPSERWASMAAVATALVEGYAHETGQVYARPAPGLDATDETRDVERRTKEGATWRPGRQVLGEVAEVLQMPLTAYEPHLPPAGGPLRAQVMADLTCHEVARQLLVAAALQSRAMEEPLAIFTEEMALIETHVGDHSAAIAGYERAIAIRERLVAGGRLDLEPDLAGVYMNQGVVLATQGDLAGALATYARSIEIRERLAAAGRLKIEPGLATGYMNQSVALAAQGDLAAALAANGRAIEILERLVAAGHFDLDPDLASVYMNQGIALATQGDLAAALAANGRAIEILERLVAAGRLELEPDLASGYMNHGIALATQGDLAAALAANGRAIEMLERLVAAGRLELEPGLARAYANRGNALQIQGKFAAALAAYADAIELLEHLVAAGRLELEPDLATVYMIRGVALDTQGDLAAAIANYGRAIEIWERLVTAGRFEFEPDLATVYMNSGVALKSQGHLAAALAAYTRTIDIRERLVVAGRLELEPGLARAHANRGNALQNQATFGAALTAYARAIAIGERLVTAGRLELEPELAKVYANTGVALAAADDLRLADARLTDAINIFERWVANGYLQFAPTLDQVRNMRRQLPASARSAPTAPLTGTRPRIPPSSSPRGWFARMRQKLGL